MGILCCLVGGGIEVGFVFALRSTLLAWPPILLGSVAAIVMFAGFIPPYFDIYREKRVRGFSWSFLCIDMVGAISSMASIMLEDSKNMDYVGMVTYIAVMVGESGYFAAALYFIIAKRIKGEKKDDKHNMDEDTESETDPVTRPLTGNAAV